mgnify:CR=1 FL=1
MPHRLKLKLWTTTQREREEDRDRLGFSFPGGCDIMLRYRPEEVRRMERGSGHNDKLDLWKCVAIYSVIFIHNDCLLLHRMYSVSPVILVSTQKSPFPDWNPVWKV